MVYYTTCDPLMAEYESDAHKYISKYGSKTTNFNRDVVPMKCSTHEYAKAIRRWMQDCELTFMLNNSRSRKYHEFMQSENDAKDNSNIPISTPPNTSAPTTTSPTTSTSTTNSNNEHNNYYIPSLWKRFLAECIDFVYLFIIKCTLIITYFEYVGNSSAETTLEMLNTTNFIATDIETLIEVTGYLFAIEIFMRIITMIYEALMIAGVIPGIPAGQTPGKLIVGIKVIHCEYIQSLPSNRFSVRPAEKLTVYQSLLRTFLKNLLNFILVPISLTAFLNNHRRTLYDSMSRCLVVDCSHNEI